MLSRRPLACLALVLLATWTCRPVQARMTDAAWRKTAATAKKLMGKRGRVNEKLPLLRALAKEDTRRAAELVFTWHRTSRTLVAEHIAPEVTKRRADAVRYEARIAKKHHGDIEEASDLERSRLAKRRDALTAAEADAEIEARVQTALAKTVDALTEAEALVWLSQRGVPALLADRSEGPLLDACLGRLLQGPPSAVAPTILAILQRHLAPPAHLAALLWVGRHKPKNAALRLGPSLAASSPAVRRATIRVLGLLDDVRSVPLLIEGLTSASGLPAEEIEILLQRFTGKTFSADHDAWKQWWAAEGEAWLGALDAAKRFDPLTMSGGVSFYGLRSPSKRVAFVLDRSGSMKAPAVHFTQAAPTTGGDKESWAGKTRLEVAKIQLARTINNLASDVLFTLIFYDYKVKVWQEPPTLVEASRKNKAEAQKWFMSLEPGSSTSLFDGLMKALEYAEHLTQKGPREGPRKPAIDTIFLLSDGAPTHFRGKDLRTPADVEAAYQVFKRANGERRIVVHAIGVGQGHNETLMKKIARESGGKYVAVGMD